VRRNKLTDFRSIRSNGLIAMKLEEEGEKLVSVKIAREDEDVMLATAQGKAIRFPVDDIRVFSGRTSTGVRGDQAGGEQVRQEGRSYLDVDPETCRRDP
jgi:DNA gyrase subunit A